MYKLHMKYFEYEGKINSQHKYKKLKHIRFNEA